MTPIWPTAGSLTSVELTVEGVSKRFCADSFGLGIETGRDV